LVQIIFDKEVVDEQKYNFWIVNRSLFNN